MIFLQQFSWYFSRGTKQFSIYVSAKSNYDWTFVLTNNIPQIASGAACSEVPLHTFLVKRRARYMKIILETFYGNGPGLKYIGVDHRAN